MEKNTIKLNEAQLRQIVAESVKKVLNEVNENYDYDGNYEKLIRDEMHRLYDLSLKVPKCYETEIYSMVTTMQGILDEIQRNRDYDNWNY